MTDDAGGGGAGGRGDPGDRGGRGAADDSAASAGPETTTDGGPETTTDGGPETTTDGGPETTTDGGPDGPLAGVGPVDDLEATVVAARRRRRAKILGGAAVAAVVAWYSLGATGFRFGEAVANLGDWWRFVSAFLSPDFGDLTVLTRERELTGVLDPVVVTLTNPGSLSASLGRDTNLVGGAVTTMAIAVAGTAAGWPLAMLLGVLGSERVTRFPANFAFRGLMSAIRAVPALVWVLVYIPLVGINPAGAFLAVATDTVGNLGRLVTDELEEIDEGPIEAVRSTGAGRVQTVVFGMLSQVTNAYIAWTLYIVEINVRIAISLGVVGAGGIGQYIRSNIRRFAFAEAAAGIIVVIAMVLSVELLSSRIRARLRPDDDDHDADGVVEALRRLADRARWAGVGRRS